MGLVYAIIAVLAAVLLAGAALAVASRRGGAERGGRRGAGGKAGYARGEYRTLSGDRVKSEGERVIADYLHRRGVKFEYEPRYPAMDVEYHPDFRLAASGAYIEHLGLNKDGSTAPFVSERRYWADIRWKRKLHSRRGTRLYETYHWQHEDGVLEAAVEEILRDVGGQCTK